MECEFSRPNIEAIWQKDNADIKYSLENNRYNKKVDGNVYRLTIYEAKLEDAGAYSCVVKSTKTSCEVKVLLNIEKGLSDQKCIEGDNVKFEIKLNRDLNKENITWYKDGIKLEDGDENGRVKIISDGKNLSLMINNAKIDDIGAYEVRFGNLKSTANLKVKGIYFIIIYLYINKKFLNLI